MLESLRLNNNNRPLSVVKHWRDEGDLKLDCEYQRGDVWGPTRQINLIRSLLLGIPISAIVVNDRLQGNWPGDDMAIYAVIDGKQRLTAILKFLDGELAVPGEWFNLDGEITFDKLPLSTRRRFKNKPIPFCEAALPTIEMEQEVFELVNFGGVSQGETDFCPVSKLNKE